MMREMNIKSVNPERFGDRFVQIQSELSTVCPHAERILYRLCTCRTNCPLNSADSDLIVFCLRRAVARSGHDASVKGLFDVAHVDVVNYVAGEDVSHALSVVMFVALIVWDVF